MNIQEQIKRARELDCMLASHAKSKRAYAKMQDTAEDLVDALEKLYALYELTRRVYYEVGDATTVGGQRAELLIDLRKAIAAVEGE